MHWTCARNTWCEHASLPLPFPSPFPSPGSPSVTHTYRPHEGLPHMLLHSTHSFLQCHRSLLAVEGHWVGEEHGAVGALLDMRGGSQRPHLSSRGVCDLPSKYSWLAMSCLVYIPVSMALAEMFVLKNLFCSLQVCPLLQRLSAVFLPKTCE